MKFLIDNQLPGALARHLQAQGLDSFHVENVGLSEAKDREIWRYAAVNGCVIVSKDEDFLHLAGADPAGPALVWIRLGNCRKAALLAAVDRALPQLIEALSRGDKVVELR